MNILRKTIVLSFILFFSALVFESTAAQNCPTCGGYWYKAYTQINTNGWVTYQYADRGAYNSAEECQQAVFLDEGNNDGWLPYYGSPVCAFRFESDYPGYKEILDWWNQSAPPSHGGAGVMDNRELIGKILRLREEFDVKAYEHKLDVLITDPEIDVLITDPER